MTEHALIMCRKPGRHSTLDKGHEEGGSVYANAGSSLRSPTGYSRASPPKKNQSLPTVLLCALTSDVTWGCPPPQSPSLCPSVKLQLQFIKFLVILLFNSQLSLHLERGTHHAYKLCLGCLDPLEKVSRVRHLPLFERAPGAYVSGANFLS